MRKSPDAWTKVGIVLAIFGITTAIAGRAVANPLLYWVAVACVALAAVLFLISLVTWCISAFTVWECVAGAFGATLLAVTLIVALLWTGPGPGSQADVALRQPNGLTPPEAGPQKRQTGVMASEILPGYTGTLLMQLDRNYSNANESIFEDADAEGSRISFSALENNEFVFTVTDIHGKNHSLNISSGPGGIPGDKNVYVAYEAGTTKTSSFLRALVDGTEVSRRNFDSPIDFGNRKWSAVTGPDRTKMRGARATTEGRLLAPWALGDSKLAEVEANFRAAHQDFFNGDDTMLYAPAGSRPSGAPPTSGTFVQSTMPPS